MKILALIALALLTACGGGDPEEPSACMAFDAADMLARAPLPPQAASAVQSVQKAGEGC